MVTRDPETRKKPEAALQEAARFERSVRKNMASPEPTPPRFSALVADVGHWRHPAVKEKWQFVVMVDEGSRFELAKIFDKGKQQRVSAAQVITTLREAWLFDFWLPPNFKG